MLWIISGIILTIIAILVIRNYIRGYVWKDKQGNKLKFKDFLKKWKNGISECSPKQQTKIQIISMFPIFAGVIWGITVTAIMGMYWLTLILTGSLPITSVQFISNLQKYKAQKKAEEAMQQVNNLGEVEKC